MSEKTRNNAIKKLDNLAVHVGYPDKPENVYTKLKVTAKKDGGTLYENSVALNKIGLKEHFATLNEPTNREDWLMGAIDVNAYYDPSSNSINFPAAILQAPFYSAKASDSANHGAVGMVIGHEISHAFDTQGSKYDENGNLANWWTKEDKQAFDKRAKAMEKLFDGRKSVGGKVNGELTLVENIADQGGLSCALEATSELADPDYQAFYESYAKMWRSNTTKEQAASLLKTDFHSPNKLRVNLQSSNTDKFYDVYSVKKDDPMYLAPKERVKIW